MGAAGYCSGESRRISVVACELRWGVFCSWSESVFVWMQAV